MTDSHPSNTRQTRIQQTGTQHVVLGAGVIGSGVARRLADQGERVRLITR